ncbi:MAG: BolA family protein [Granulosicoccaceae bacterium]|jgi:BolA protein
MTDNTARIEEMRKRLQAAFDPESIEIEDESHLHAGHAGAKSGKGHFNVSIVSDKFSGKTLIQRHRMVYEAMGELMQTDIHALSISAYTPEEL